MIVIYDDKSYRADVKSHLNAMGFPHEMSNEARMLKADVESFLPRNPDDPISWKRMELPPSTPKGLDGVTDGALHPTTTTTHIRHARTHARTHTHTKTPTHTYTRRHTRMT